jgi:hypothetical protein
MGSLMLRPADSPPPLERRLDPAYLNAPVARSRPAGRYTLNRQLAWEAPFILRENERLRWAYAYLKDAARDSQFTEVPQGTKQFEPWT